MPPRSAAVAIPALDLSVQVRRTTGRKGCMTTHCRNPARLSVEVLDRTTGRRRSFRACPECRSTAMLEILEGGQGR